MGGSKRLTRIALAAAAFLCSTVGGAANKLKADELVALHLKAIGENLVRKNRVAQGLGTVDIRVGNRAKMAGPAMLLAEGNKLRTEINFGHPQYAREALIRSGEKLDIAYVSPGARSRLGSTLWDFFPRLVQEGLYGGILSTDWALLDLDKRQAKIRYHGLKKFEGRKLHRLEYRPKNGVDYRIRIYFEPETYRHVASRYRLTLPAGMGRGLVDIRGGAFGAGSGPADKIRIRLTETFSDFKEVDGLTLPHRYRIALNTSAIGGFVGHWEIKIQHMMHDQRIAARAFAIQ
jgi:hypothetical protein